MVWIPAGAWIAAALVAIVVLGFCAYEIAWKTRRLRADLVALRTTSEQLGELAAGVAAARARVSAAGRD